jgi:hypothetical protein
MAAGRRAELDDCCQDERRIAALNLVLAGLRSALFQSPDWYRSGARFYEGTMPFVNVTNAGANIKKKKVRGSGHIVKSPRPRNSSVTIGITIAPPPEV